MNFTDAHHARAQCTPIRSRPSRRLRGLSPSRRLLLQVGAMSACGSISARAIVTTELISEATRLQGLGKVRANRAARARVRVRVRVRIRARFVLWHLFGALALVSEPWPFPDPDPDPNVTANADANPDTSPKPIPNP